MAAFVVGQIHVTNEPEWRSYVEQVGDVITRFGGEIIFRGRQSALFSGHSAMELCVVIRFGDVAAACRWHDSDEYQRLAVQRDRGAEVDLILYDGVS